MTRTLERLRVRLIVAMTAALAVTMSFGIGAGAASAATGEPDCSTMALCYLMNETTGPMIDSSPNHVNSIKIMQGITRDGSAYHFSGVGSVIVPNSPVAQVGTRDFIATVQLHLDPLPVCENGACDMNFFQKGGFNDNPAFGQWKVEMSGTHVHCRIFGDQGEASVWYFGIGQKLTQGTPGTPGYWHTITCQRVGDKVTLSVDGKTTKNSVETVATGNVTTPRNVTVGGKGQGCGTNCDYTRGYLNYATLQYLP